MSRPAPIYVETRFRYNQAFKSVYSIIPGVIMLILMLIPAMLTARRRGSREGGRLHRQFPLDAGDAGGISRRQAGALCALSLRELLPAASDGAPSCSACRCAAPCSALMLGALRSISTPRRRSGILFSSFLRTQVAAIFAHRDRLDHSRGEFLRPARAGLLAVRRAAAGRPRLSLRLVSGDQHRRLHQRARISRRSAPISLALAAFGAVYSALRASRAAASRRRKMLSSLRHISSAQRQRARSLLPIRSCSPSSSMSSPSPFIRSRPGMKFEVESARSRRGRRGSFGIVAPHRQRAAAAAIQDAPT